MSNWYEAEIMMQEHYKDLLREADERARAGMVPQQRCQRRSLLQTLSRQVERAITWGTRVQEGKVRVRMQASDCQ
jgi:hypothetical protein